MGRGKGALAERLDFEGQRAAPSKPARLRLEVPSAVFRGTDKYKVLEHRRRQAQIKARRLLELMG